MEAGNAMQDEDWMAERARLLEELEAARKRRGRQVARVRVGGGGEA